MNPPKPGPTDGAARDPAGVTHDVAARRRVRLGYAAMGTVALFWTGFNIISRMGGRGDLTGFDIGALRFGVSALILLPVFLRRPFAIAWPRLFALSAFGGIGYALLVYCGFMFAPAAHAGILVNGGIPFSTALVAWVMLGFRPNRGVLMAFAATGLGIALMAWHSLGATAAAAPRQWLGDILFLGGALCWGVFGVLLRKWCLRPLDAMAGLAVFSAALYLPVYLLYLPATLACAPAGQVALQAVYQGVVVAICGGMLFAFATQAIGPVKASLVLALVPGITALAAVPLLGEPVDATTVIGLICVTLGAVLGAIASAPHAPARLAGR